MANAYFEYNGRKSTEFGIRIQNSIAYPSPEADVEIEEMPGRDGDLIIDNERFKSMPFSIPIRVNTREGETLNELASKISGWLKSDLGFHPLKLSTEPDYYHEAIQIEGFNIEETIRDFGRTVINFNLNPNKKATKSEWIELTSGDVIENKHNRKAKPIITIKGTGDLDLKKNGQDWLSLREIDTEITIDSNLKSVYRGERPQYNKMVDLDEGSFPLLEPGENEITWDGAEGITEIKIEPRWEMIS